MQEAQVEETATAVQEESALPAEFTVETNTLLRIQNAFYKQQNAQLRLEQARIGASQLEQEFQRAGTQASETLASYVQQELGLTLQEFVQQYDFNVDTGVVTTRQTK
jgi:hypothetical protein